MDRSEQLNELAGALALAQSEIQHAEKASDNPHLGKKYASLASVWDACREPLTKNGLSVAQYVVPSEPGSLRLVTLLMHKSGQYLSGMEEMPVLKNDPQTYGAAVTYARRFGLAAMVGVCPDDDTDGEGLNAPKQQAGRNQQSRPQGSPQQRPQQQARPRDAAPESSGDRSATSAAAPAKDTAGAFRDYKAAYARAYNTEVNTDAEKAAFRAATAGLLGLPGDFRYEALTVAQYEAATQRVTAKAAA